MKFKVLEILMNAKYDADIFTVNEVCNRIYYTV